MLSTLIKGRGHHSRRRVFFAVFALLFILGAVMVPASYALAGNSDTGDDVSGCSSCGSRPTEEPTEEPRCTPDPTDEPTKEPDPTVEPTEEPDPTVEPTEEPTEEPTMEPTEEPTEEPTMEPTEEPTEEPTMEPTEEPTEEPTVEPTEEPTTEPTPTDPDDDDDSGKSGDDDDSSNSGDDDDGVVIVSLSQPSSPAPVATEEVVLPELGPTAIEAVAPAAGGIVFGLASVLRLVGLAFASIGFLGMVVVTRFVF
jgi:hypothetical protein